MFCAKCGAKIEDGAAFCAACGWKVAKRSEGQNEKPAEQAVTQAVDHVENEIRSQVTGKVQSEVTQVTARAKNEIRTQVSGQVKQAAAEATGLLGIDAAELPGEVALGEFGGALGSLSSILGPGRTFVTSIKEFFKSFTSLKALIPALIIAVIWLVQALLTYNGVEGDFLDVTKVITYMRGGLGRSAVGFVGGLIGKGVIAAAFATIVTGGELQILKGIPRLFTGKNFKKNSIGFYLLGIGLSLMLYQFFAGNATIESIAAAVSAMLLSLRALGGRCGFLFSLVRSMTAKKTAAGARTPRDEKPQALFAGLTAGFVLAIPLSLIPSDSDFLSTLSLESNLIPLLLGVLLTVLGLVFSILGLVRTTALATGLLILLLPVLPFFAQKASAVSTFTIIPDWDMEEFREGGLFYKSNYGWHPAHTMFLFANAGELTIESTGNGYHLTVPGVSGEWNNELQGQDLEGNSYWVKKWEYEGFSMTAPKEEKGKGSIDQCIITFTLDSPFTLYYYHENHWQPKPEWTDDWDIKELTGTVREMKLVLTIREPDGTPNAWMDWEEDVSWVENITGYDSYSGDQDFKHTLENVQKRDRNMGYLTQGFKMPGEDDTEEEEEEIDDEKEIEITTDADEDEGETEEEIEEEIVVKKKKNKKSKKTKNEDDRDPADVALVSTTGAGAAAAGAAAASGKTGTEDADEDKKKKKRYKMKVKKDFGNRISSGEVKEVYARIVEVDPETGEEKDRPDLSDRIEIYSDDGVFEPQMNGGLSGGYKGAVVKVANDVKATEGCICFRFIGEGGSFTNRMRFLVTAPMLEFDQPNIAIAHDFDKPVKPYFVVIGMSDAHKVSAKITPDDAFDVNITEGEDLGVEGAKLYYANITPKSSRPSMEDRAPGASLYYRMEVEAVEPSNGVKVTNELPIARVRTGLTVTAKSIDCFWYKHATSQIAEYDGLRRRVVVREKFAETKAELKLIWFDEEEQKIRILAPMPKAFVVKAENSEEQELVDKLRIQMDPGNDAEFGSEGGLKVSLRPTKGYLDAPRRVKTKIHIEATAMDKVFSTDQEFLLCSQPDRSGMDLPQISKAIRDDEEVGKKLEHLRDVIKRTCYDNLFPVHRMIEEMLNGYDPEYGYDEEQVATVINTYNDFCRGYIAGANAEPAEGETIIDYMLWAIDAMGDAADRLEKKAGFLGRLALGFATAGMSEIAFTTMDIVRIPYRMKQAMERGEDSYLGVMWAGAKDIVLGEVQSRVIGAVQKGSWVMTKAFAKDMKNPKLYNLLTKAETGYTKYAANIQKANEKTTIYKDGVFRNPFKADVDPAKAAAAAKQAKLTDQQLDMELDAKIKEARAKNKATDFEGATEHGVEVRERADGSLEVVGRDLSDPAVAASFKAYEKVVKLQRARNQYYQSKTPEAKLEMENCMLEIREDFIAQNQLKNYNKLYADEVRIEYDNYWTNMDAKIDAKAAQNIATRTGKDPSSIYCRSISTNQKDYVRHTHGVDHDMTMMEKTGEGKADIEIDDRIQAEENALAVYETIKGEKAPSVQEAMEFAERYQYTTVAGEGQYAREKYGDVPGMLTPEGHGKALQNVKQNADAMQYKVEQYVDKAEANLAEAAKHAPGSQEYINAHHAAQKNLFEAERTGFKQFGRTINGRNDALILQGKGNQLSHKEQLCYKLLQRYYKGAKEGHLNIDSGDMMNTMREIGVENPRELAQMMSDLTYRVADGN